MYRQWVPCGCNSTYSFPPIVLKLCRYFLHEMKVCKWFWYTTLIIFSHFFCFVNLVSPFSSPEPQWDGRTKVYSRGLGHMTKMTATPIYGKTLQKSSSPEPKGQWPCGLVCSIGALGPFVQMMTLGWPWPILRQGQIWSLMLFYGENCCKVI